MANKKIQDETLINPALEDLVELVDDPSGTPGDAYSTLQRVLGVMGFVPGGRLTLTSGVPVTVSDVVAAGTLYYTPYAHPFVRVWDGTRWLLRQFSEISLALTLTADKNYDVFLDDDGATLVLSAAWTNDTTRADALGTQDGIRVLNSDKTKLWLGTIRASASNVTEDSGTNVPTTSARTAKRFVWNAYNRVQRMMRITEDANTWNYSTATFRAWNGNNNNRVEFVLGSVIEPVKLLFACVAASDTPSNNHTPGIGLDSTTTNSAFYSIASTTAVLNISSPMFAEYMDTPALGYHYLQPLEKGPGANTSTWYGDAGAPTVLQSGATGHLFA